MAVMGGIIGAGIFINPYIVAERVHTSALILGAWVAGGMIASTFLNLAFIPVLYVVVKSIGRARAK
jgi:hypothetical protein